MGIPGKGLTTYLSPRIKMPHNTYNERFAITDITKQAFSKLLENFENPPY